MIVNNVSAFLGLISYYRRFFKSFDHVASTLNDLFKNDAFRLTDLEVFTFVKLKEVLSTFPILCLINFQKIFTVETGTTCNYALEEEGTFESLRNALDLTEVLHQPLSYQSLHKYEK